MHRLAVPAYRSRISRNRKIALVTLRDAVTGARRDVGLGEWGTPASRAAYTATIKAWEEGGRRLAAPATCGLNLRLGPSIAQIVALYLADSEGKMSHSELGWFRAAAKPLLSTHGETPAMLYGPRALRQTREAMVKLGWNRATVNAATRRVRSIFKWAVGQELVPATNLEALRAVEPLRRGQTAAPEADPVRPVSPAAVAGTLAHLSPTVAAHGFQFFYPIHAFSVRKYLQDSNLRECRKITRFR